MSKREGGRRRVKGKGKKHNKKEKKGEKKEMVESSMVIELFI